MAVCGAVLTVSDDPSQASTIIEEIGLWFHHVQLGEAQGSRVPIVIDTPDRSSFLGCWQGLLELEGVLDLELAYVHYDPGDHAQQTPSRRANGEAR